MSGSALKIVSLLDTVAPTVHVDMATIDPPECPEDMFDSDVNICMHVTRCCGDDNSHGSVRAAKWEDA